MESQTKQIKSILERYEVKTILDCSCGSGLQAIGLAKEGYAVEGGDLSVNMIGKAKQYANEASVFIKFKQSEPGGIALFDLRNYDAMLKEKNRFSPMRINDIKDDIRYSIVYVFDYLDHKVRFNILYLIEDLETGEKQIVNVYSQTASHNTGISGFGSTEILKTLATLILFRGYK